MQLSIYTKNIWSLNNYTLQTHVNLYYCRKNTYAPEIFKTCMHKKKEKKEKTKLKLMDFKKRELIKKNRNHIKKCLLQLYPL